MELSSSGCPKTGTTDKRAEPSDLSTTFRTCSKQGTKDPKEFNLRSVCTRNNLLFLREFLRKKLINQSVHVTVDYIQPANNEFPEKMCATVTIGGVNVAEALVAKGLVSMWTF